MGEIVLLAFTANDRWQAGIGDPTFMGWFTVGAYFLTAGLCLVAARVSPLSGFLSERRFWWSLTVGLLLLGINKQLDLQTWFTLTGKHLAQQTGWYAERRIAQAIFIFLIAGAGVGLVLLLWGFARKRVRQYRLALSGTIFLGCFILIRAASFHHVDQMLGWQVGGLRMNHFLECGGIFLIALAALKTLRPGRTHIPSQRELSRSSGTRLMAAKSNH
jgi:hypothetical protein